jgi:adenylate cyclase
MVKFYNSLMFRLTISFVLLIVLITGLTYFYTYNEAKNALKQTIQDQLKSTATIAASQFTPERVSVVASLKPGDDERPEYKEINEMLYSMRKDNKDINEFYAMTREGDKVFFVIDDWTIDNIEEMSSIGDEYEDYDPKLLEAFDGKTVSSDDFYTDAWGTFLSGYAPIKDADGKTVAVLAVDMKVDTVTQKINFIGSLIYYVVGAGILAAGLLIAFFSFTIIKDLNAMTKVAEKLSSGDLDIKLPELKTKSEIYELNEGLKSVTAAIEMYKEASSPSKKPTATKKKGE